MIDIRTLEWDSCFFNKKIGLLSVSDTDKIDKEVILSKMISFDVVQIKIPSMYYFLAQDLKEIGFQYIEGEVSFSCPVSEKSPSSFKFEIAKIDDFQNLCKITAGSFKYSRFKEPYFSHMQREKFYCQWIKNAILGVYDDMCLVLKDEDDCILGYVTLKHLFDGAKIGLLCVSPKFLGMGIGTRLINLSKDSLLERKIGTLYVATQLSNIEAQKLYKKNNFIEKDECQWLYFSRHVNS